MGVTKIGHVLVTDGSESRPSGADFVLWVGGNTRPFNMTNTDVWLQDPSATGSSSDTTAPTAPGVPTSSSVTQTGMTVNFTAATDNVGVTSYQVFFNGTLKGTTTGLSLAVTGLSAGTAYSVTVRALDAAGNASATSSASLSTAAATGTGDTTPPSVPTGVAASSITQTGFALTWTASTDDVGVTGYDVQIDGTSVAQPSTNSYTVTGRTAGTVYSVRVRARDAAGNWSALSTAVSVTTTAASTGTAKHSVWGTTTPSGTFASGTDGSPNIEAGNCFYRYGSGTGYYTNSQIVGGKIYKPAGVTVPAGTVTMRIYSNAAGFGADFGTLVGTKQINVSTLVDGWNQVLLDTPATMPGAGGVVIVTLVWDGNTQFYVYNPNARADGNFMAALDGTKLAWSDVNGAQGYYPTRFRIGTTYGAPAAGTTSYCTDLVINEGP